MEKLAIGSNPQLTSEGEAVFGKTDVHLFYRGFSLQDLLSNVKIEILTFRNTQPVCFS